MGDDVVKRTRERAAAMTSEQRVKVGVKILLDTKSGYTQQAKMHYLLSAGLSMTEYLEALNEAGNGELLKVALS